MNNLLNKKFDRLLVIKPLLKRDNKSGCILWKCMCKCGNTIIARSNNLISKKTKSCGCLNKEIVSDIGKLNYKHGFSNDYFYNIWCHLKNRCDDKKHIAFENYGGRGITYDPRWDSFIKFKEDMYFKYIWAKKKYINIKLSIERMNVNGNYCFENCIFIPLRDQWKNTRKNNKQD
jgi:hypothetical protein